MSVEGVCTVALVDTGAAVSVINADLCRLLKKVTTPLPQFSLCTATAQRVKPVAACTARVMIQDVVYPVEFLVLPSCSHDVILGWDFLSRHRAIIDCERAQVEFDSALDAPYDDLQSAAPTKLIVAHDTDIPPRSAALVPLCCPSVPDAPALFRPSPL